MVVGHTDISINRYRGCSSLISVPKEKQEKKSFSYV